MREHASFWRFHLPRRVFVCSDLTFFLFNVAIPSPVFPDLTAFLDRCSVVMELPV